MGERWCTVTVIEQSGRRHSVDVVASSTFDAAHIFVTHAKADPRNGIPRLSLESVFEIVAEGKTPYRGKSFAAVDFQGEGGTQRPARDFVLEAPHREIRTAAVNAQ